MAGPAGPATEKDHLHRRLHRRHRSDRDVLVALPPDMPGIVITQHMPAGFTKSFAQRLDGLCKIHVKEAAGRRPHPARPCLHRAGRPHLSVERSGRLHRPRHRRRTGEPPPPLGRGAVPSAARWWGRTRIGVMLTGMGADGATAMRK
jgi:two-component system chemotaxis response regulator CheB